MNGNVISGVYETLRSYEGVFVFLEEHEARMRRSCEAIGVAAPNLHEIAGNFEGEKGRDVRLRVAVSAAGEVKIEDFDLPRWHGSFLWNEVWRVKLFDGARENASLKSTDTVMQAEARELARKDGYGEILLVNKDGLVTEGGVTNVFFVEGLPEGGVRVVTPRRGMLPGISRALILRACEELGIELVERDVSAEEIENFEAIFLTNSIRGMVATEEGPIPPVMRRIADRGTEFIRKEILKLKK